MAPAGPAVGPESLSAIEASGPTGHRRHAEKEKEHEHWRVEQKETLEEGEDDNEEEEWSEEIEIDLEDGEDSEEWEDARDHLPAGARTHSSSRIQGANPSIGDASRPESFNSFYSFRSAQTSNTAASLACSRTGSFDQSTSPNLALSPAASFGASNGLQISSHSTAQNSLPLGTLVAESMAAQWRGNQGAEDLLARDTGSCVSSHGTEEKGGGVVAGKGEGLASGSGEGVGGGHEDGDSAERLKGVAEGLLLQQLQERQLLLRRQRRQDQRFKEGAGAADSASDRGVTEHDCQEQGTPFVPRTKSLGGATSAAGAAVFDVVSKPKAALQHTKEAIGELLGRHSSRTAESQSPSSPNFSAPVDLIQVQVGPPLAWTGGEQDDASIGLRLAKWKEKLARLKGDLECTVNEQTFLLYVRANDVRLTSAQGLESRSAVPPAADQPRRGMYPSKDEGEETFFAAEGTEALVRARSEEKEANGSGQNWQLRGTRSDESQGTGGKLEGVVKVSPVREVDLVQVFSGAAVVAVFQSGAALRMEGSGDRVLDSQLARLINTVANFYFSSYPAQEASASKTAAQGTGAPASQSRPLGGSDGAGKFPHPAGQAAAGERPRMPQGGSLLASDSMQGAEGKDGKKSSLGNLRNPLQSAKALFTRPTKSVLKLLGKSKSKAPAPLGPSVSGTLGLEQRSRSVWKDSSASLGLHSQTPLREDQTLDSAFVLPATEDEAGVTSQMPTPPSPDASSTPQPARKGPSPTEEGPVPTAQPSVDLPTACPSPGAEQRSSFTRPKYIETAAEGLGPTPPQPETDVGELPGHVAQPSEHLAEAKCPVPGAGHAKSPSGPMSPWLSGGEDTGSRRGGIFAPMVGKAADSERQRLHVDYFETKATMSKPPPLRPMTAPSAGSRERELSEQGNPHASKADLSRLWGMRGTGDASLWDLSTTGHVPVHRIPAEASSADGEVSGAASNIRTHRKGEGLVGDYEGVALDKGEEEREGGERDRGKEDQQRTASPMLAQKTVFKHSLEPVSESSTWEQGQSSHAHTMVGPALGPQNSSTPRMPEGRQLSLPNPRAGPNSGALAVAAAMFGGKGRVGEAVRRTKSKLGGMLAKEKGVSRKERRGRGGGDVPSSSVVFMELKLGPPSAWVAGVVNEQAWRGRLRRLKETMEGIINERQYLIHIQDNNICMDASQGIKREAFGEAELFSFDQVMDAATMRTGGSNTTEEEASWTWAELCRALGDRRSPFQKVVEVRPLSSADTLQLAVGEALAASFSGGMADYSLPTGDRVLDLQLRKFFLALSEFYFSVYTAAPTPTPMPRGPGTLSPSGEEHPARSYAAMKVEAPPTTAGSISLQKPGPLIIHGLPPVTFSDSHDSTQSPALITQSHSTESLAESDSPGSSPSPAAAVNDPHDALQVHGWPTEKEAVCHARQQAQQEQLVELGQSSSGEGFSFQPAPTSTVMPRKATGVSASVPLLGQGKSTTEEAPLQAEQTPLWRTRSFTSSPLHLTASPLSLSPASNTPDPPSPTILLPAPPCVVRSSTDEKESEGLEQDLTLLAGDLDSAPDASSREEEVSSGRGTEGEAKEGGEKDSMSRGQVVALGTRSSAPKGVGVGPHGEGEGEGVPGNASRDAGHLSTRGDGKSNQTKEPCCPVERLASAEGEKDSLEEESDKERRREDERSKSVGKTEDKLLLSSPCSFEGSVVGKREGMMGKRGKEGEGRGRLANQESHISESMADGISCMKGVLPKAGDGLVPSLSKGQAREEEGEGEKERERGVQRRTSNAASHLDALFARDQQASPGTSEGVSSSWSKQEGEAGDQVTILPLKEDKGTPTGTHTQSAALKGGKKEEAKTPPARAKRAAQSVPHASPAEGGFTRGGRGVRGAKGGAGTAKGVGRASLDPLTGSTLRAAEDEAKKWMELQRFFALLSVEESDTGESERVSVPPEKEKTLTVPSQLDGEAAERKARSADSTSLAKGSSAQLEQVKDDAVVTVQRKMAPGGKPLSAGVAEEAPEKLTDGEGKVEGPGRGIGYSGSVGQERKGEEDGAKTAPEREKAGQSGTKPQAGRARASGTLANDEHGMDEYSKFISRARQVAPDAVTSVLSGKASDRAQERSKGRAVSRSESREGSGEGKDKRELLLGKESGVVKAYPMKWASPGETKALARGLSTEKVLEVGSPEAGEDGEGGLGEVKEAEALDTLKEEGSTVGSRDLGLLDRPGRMSPKGKETPCELHPNNSNSNKTAVELPKDSSHLLSSTREEGGKRGLPLEKSKGEGGKEVPAETGPLARLGSFKDRERGYDWREMRRVREGREEKGVWDSRVQDITDRRERRERIGVALSLTAEGRGGGEDRRIPRAGGLVPREGEEGRECVSARERRERREQRERSRERTEVLGQDDLVASWKESPLHGRREDRVGLALNEDREERRVEHDTMSEVSLHRTESRELRRERRAARRIREEGEGREEGEKGVGAKGSTVEMLKSTRSREARDRLGLRTGADSADRRRMRAERRKEREAEKDPVEHLTSGV